MKLTRQGTIRLAEAAGHSFIGSGNYLAQVQAGNRFSHAQCSTLLDGASFARSALA